MIFIDSNIFILAFDHLSPEGKQAKKYLETIPVSKEKFFTSVITIHEVLTGVYKLGKEEKIPIYKDYISANGMITVLPITEDIAIMSAKIRATHPSIKTPDAIQLAAALAVSAKVFITQDKRLPSSLDGMTITPLSPFL